MDTLLDGLTIHISAAEWFLGILLVFVYAFVIVHFIEKKSENHKTANPLWFYICCFILAIFVAGLGKSNFIYGIWAALWSAVKMAVIGQGVYVLLDAFGLIAKIEAVMKKKLDK